jgi:hypothetical protein
MGDVKTNSKGLGDLIETGQGNQKGLIGVIALGVIAVGGMAIKAIAGGK